MRRSTLIAALAAAVLVPLALVGCGGDSSSEEPAAPAPSSSAAGTVVDVVLGGNGKEFSLTATPGEIAAGPVTFTVANQGAMVHELVVVKTDKGGAGLATADGSADETGALGEVADLAAGATQEIQLDLEPGAYVLLCSLPGHYAGGMWLDFTVS